MKRFLALILVLLILLPFSSCSASDENKTEETKENASSQKNEKNETEEDDFQYPEVCDTLTPEALEAIPIAKDTMTEEELRQICLDYFHLQLTFAWTLSKNINYTIVSSGSQVKLQRGTVYGGLPYVTDSLGNLYRVFDFYDTETGVVTPPANMKDQDFAEIFGNQCSYGSYWAWSRVCNSTSYRYTNTILAANGVIPVGPYTYDKTIKKFTECTTKQICQDNGEQTMYQSYAALKPADGLVQYTTAGHVIMCATEPVITYKSDNTIDGEKSYIKIMDQNGGWDGASQSDGTYYEVQGGIYTKRTFAKLFNSNYIPFTFAEFQGKDPVEEGDASLDLVDGKNTLEDLKGSTLTANYPLSHLHIKVLDEKGEEAYFYVSRTNQLNDFTFSMTSCIFPMTLKKYADGKHTLEITCFLGNGEKFTVFNDTVRT